MTTQDPSLESLFAAYLASRAADAGAKARGNPKRPAAWLPDAEQSIDLLRSALNGYGYQYLSARDERRFQRAYDDGDEGALCRLFGARVLLAYLDEFFDDFLIRKVLFQVEDLEATIAETGRFDLTGPLEVPLEVSALARPGWSINLVLARVNGRWHILEVGNVYPRVIV